MKIGVIGWYGHDNAGDERILTCLRRLFVGHELLVFGELGVANAQIPRLNQCDFVLFGGGGLILRGTGQFAALFEQLHCPFGCIGISVEAVHRDNRDLIAILRDRATFIYVRDKESARIFAQPTKVLTGPDLTFLYPYPIVDAVAEDTCGVNLRAWRFWPGEHRGFFDQCMGKLNQQVENLYSKYPLPKWSPAYAAEIAKKYFSALIPISLYNEPNTATDASVLQHYFSGVYAQFTDHSYDACRYFIGMRLHALIYACQKGIPFISLSYQPKNVVFCHELGMKQLSVDIYHTERLIAAIAYLKDNHRTLRDKMITYRNQAHLEVWAAAKHMLDVMGCQAPVEEQFADVVV